MSDQEYTGSGGQIQRVTRYELAAGEAGPHAVWRDTMDDEDVLNLIDLLGNDWIRVRVEAIKVLGPTRMTDLVALEDGRSFLDRLVAIRVDLGELVQILHRAHHARAANWVIARRGLGCGDHPCPRGPAGLDAKIYGAHELVTLEELAWTADGVGDLWVQLKAKLSAANLEFGKSAYFSHPVREKRRFYEIVHNAALPFAEFIAVLRSMDELGDLVDFLETNRK